MTFLKIWLGLLAFIAVMFGMVRLFDFLRNWSISVTGGDTTFMVCFGIFMTLLCALWIYGIQKIAKGEWE